MERLNDIMGRSAMRRPSRYEQQQQPPQQRQEQEKPLRDDQTPPLPPARRPQPEQRSNPGPRAPYPSQNTPPNPYPGPTRPQNNRRSPAPSRTESLPPAQTRPSRQYGAGATFQNQRSPLSPQRLADYGANTYRQYPPEESQSRNASEPAYRVPSQALYYHSDDISPTIEADVVSEDLYENDLEEEEQLEEADHVYYTTWEDEYENKKQYSHSATRAIADTLTPTFEAHSYDIPSVNPGSAYPRRNTNDLRNTRRPLDPATPAPPALPEPRSQAARSTPLSRSERVTQPLRPQPEPDTLRSRETTIRETSIEPPTQGRTQNRQLVTRHPVHVQPDAQELDTFVSPVAKPACPRCHGIGYLRANVPLGHPNFGKPIACVCKEVERKAKRRAQLREMSNMDAFQDSTFGTFNPRQPGVKEAFEATYHYAQSPSGWLVLIGPNGCGKTHLAAAIANQCLDAGAVVLFAVVPDLLDHLRAAFAPTATEVYDQLFSKMREAEVLILDDLGAQQSSPWANEKLFQLLNYRYNQSLPTVVTANPKGLQAMDERIRSRLSDIGLVETLHLNYARDYRPNHARKE